MNDGVVLQCVDCLCENSFSLSRHVQGAAHSAGTPGLRTRNSPASPPTDAGSLLRAGGDGARPRLDLERAGASARRLPRLWAHQARSPDRHGHLPSPSSTLCQGSPPGRGHHPALPNGRLREKPRNEPPAGPDLLGKSSLLPVPTTLRQVCV